MSQPTGTFEQLRVDCAVSSGFSGWLAQAGGSLVISTYQAGKVAMIGYDGCGVTLVMRQFDKPLGVAIQGDLMALATRHDLVVLANARLLAPDFLEDQPGRYDALYLPRASYHTGDLHVHDVVFQGEDLLVVNTRYSCLARVSHRYNFVPVWRPKFVTDLAPEDRCHLNGMAAVDGRVKYVSALATSDAAGAWRESKADGGVIVDVETDEIVLGGMSMPHSPRWHEGRLWVLNSGAGELWRVDPATGQADVVCGLPGYLRGLAFAGRYALVGLSKIREKHIFGGLPIQNRHAELQCGVAVVDLATGEQVGMFEFTAGCEELYDVQFLAGAHRPMILSIDKAAARQAVTHPESSWWLRPGAEIPENGRGGDALRDFRSLGDFGSPVTGGSASTQDLPAIETTGNLVPGSGT